jgi:hypothetical protein
LICYRFCKEKINLGTDLSKKITLPEALRFTQLRRRVNLRLLILIEWDKRKHLATMPKDISDFIVECVDANFGFNRYTERLGRIGQFFVGYTKLSRTNLH